MTRGVLHNEAASRQWTGLLFVPLRRCSRSGTYPNAQAHRSRRWPIGERWCKNRKACRLRHQELARYWATDYDWRKIEAKLNALPQFVTEIDGLDIYFLHVRSKHENALPLIVTHGWPGSVIEQLKIIDPLTNPTAHGGSASDAFHLVIPSLPGFGFSARPTTSGWGPERRKCLGSADETAWIYKICGARRRFGRGGLHYDRQTRTSKMLKMRQTPRNSTNC